MTPSEEHRYVAAALAAAGLEPDAADVAALTGDYPQLAAMARSLRDVPQPAEEPPESFQRE